jgi:DNA invertase Pin-like site-specific DNA recombinase
MESIVVDAGESAKSLRRPGMAAVLQGVRSDQVDTVVILKLDPLTRSVRDLADLLDLFERNKVALVSVSESLDTSTAGGRLMLNLLASVSQWEREAIGERTAFALAHKRRSRQVYGHVAFGYRRIENGIVPHPWEQQALATARAMRQHGWSYERIAKWLNDSDFKPSQGAVLWHRATVRQVLGSHIALESSRLETID